MSGGQRSGWDRPAAATRRYGYGVLSPEATCSVPWPLAVGRLGTHPPTSSDQSQLLLFSTPPVRDGPGPWDLGERSPGT